MDPTRPNPRLQWITHVSTKTMDLILTRPTRPNPRLEWNEHRALGAWHLYQWIRGDGWPDWDDLTPRQQASVRAGFLVGAASINKKPFTRHG